MKNSGNGYLWMLYGPIISFILGVSAFFKFESGLDISGAERIKTPSEQFYSSIAGPAFLVIFIGGTEVSFLIFIRCKRQPSKAFSRHDD